MANGKFVAYYRVSTERQGRSGLGLDAQRSAVTDYLNGGAWELVGEFTEVESGKRNDRPALSEALAHCRMYGATLVIAKLDRLSRDAHFLLGLQKSNVPFVAVDMPHADNFTVGIIAMTAQKEREMISARTIAALAAAKRRGQKLGGDRGNLPAVARLGAQKSAQIRSAAAGQRAADLRSLLEKLAADGASLRTIAQELNVRRIPTARGGEWSAVQVKRILDRLRLPS